MNSIERDQRQEVIGIRDEISVDLRSREEMHGSSQPARVLTRLRPNNVDEEQTDRDRTRDRIRRMPGISDAFWRGGEGRGGKGEKREKNKNIETGTLRIREKK